MKHLSSVLALVCAALSGCESPPVYIPPAFGTWEDNAYEVELLGDTHPVRQKPHPVAGIQVQWFRPSPGAKPTFWRYRVPAVALVTDSQANGGRPASRADYKPGQMGYLDAMVILVDHHYHPLAPGPYRSRRLRVTGKQMAGSPDCPVGKGTVHPGSDPNLPFSEMGWGLETDRSHIQDLGPLPPHTRPYFPPSIAHPR